MPLHAFTTTRGENMSRRRLLVSLTAIVVGCSSFVGVASAQSASDVEAVRAANAAFYAALSSRDAKRMTALWANKPYVVNMGPRIKTFAVGYDEAVAKWWPTAFEFFQELNVTPTVAQVQTDGKVGWVHGNESATAVSKNGPMKFTTFFTNIFEKDGDRWLIVSHHAQPIPQ
jgi:ketosteroid isomerase-like protein